MITRSVSALRAITDRKWVASSGSGVPPSMSSVYEEIDVSGVRISCPTSAMNSSLVRDSSRDEVRQGAVGTGPVRGDAEHVADLVGQPELRVGPAQRARDGLQQPGAGLLDGGRVVEPPRDGQLALHEPLGPPPLGDLVQRDD